MAKRTQRKQTPLDKIEKELSSFNKEFRKHLATFITGAFSFVAALLWRDAIKASLDNTRYILPDAGLWADYMTALVVTVAAVIVIVVISKMLKEKV